MANNDPLIWPFPLADTPLPTPPHPQTSIIAQFLGLLRHESPSCHNSSAKLHILYAEFLPAGNVSGAYSPAGNAPGGGWSGWAHPYSAFNPVSHSLGWLSETVPSSPLFPPISAQPLMTIFLLSTPCPTPSSTPNLGNGWGLPGQDLGELQTHPASLEMQPLLGVVFLLDGAPGQGFRCPSPSVSPAYQRYRSGVSLALYFQVLSLDVVHRAQEAVLFYD